MKHITKENYEKLLAAAKAVSKLENGCRQETAAYHKFILDNADRMSKEVKKLPKEYKILVQHSENLGTKKWAYIIKTTDTEFVTATSEVKETEQSITITTKTGFRTVVRKTSVIAYIF